MGRGKQVPLSLRVFQHWKPKEISYFKTVKMVKTMYKIDRYRLE